MLSSYSEQLAFLKKEEAKNHPLTEALRSRIEGDDAVSLGPKDAKVTMVMFSDYESKFCAHAWLVAKQLREEFPGDLRFVLRTFPLEKHKNAKAAAKASFLARQEGKFWQFHEQLSAHPNALTGGDLRKYMEIIGIDSATLSWPERDKAAANAVESDISLGRTLGIRYVPAIYINGENIVTQIEFDVLAKRIRSIVQGRSGTSVSHSER